MIGRRFISEEFLPELADNLSWWAVRREVNIRLYQAEGETLDRVDFPGLAHSGINCDVKRQIVITQSLYPFQQDVNC